MKEIALFPIPNCVSFPGTVFPLHVFEPRYRQMVQHCVETPMDMAVCHTQKVLHPGKDHQSLDEALSSNQATYKPFPVFSAGPCELIETLDDGRMLIQVHLKKRYRILENVQTLPFSIYGCEEYEDEPASETSKVRANETRDKIIHRLLALTREDKRWQEMLSSAEWQEKPADKFSFELMQFMQPPASVQQQLLELQSAEKRLDLILEMLNQG